MTALNKNSFLSIPFQTFLGYDKGPNGEFVINTEQAKIVRLIYKLYMEGLSTYKVAQILTEKNIPTPAGKKKWHADSVQRILSNEKYKGDALLQKAFTVDFLTKKLKKNEGEVPQYYVEGHHDAIIPRETFDLVQAEIARRNSKICRYSGVGLFSSKIKCGECGNWYRSKVWHSNDKYRKIIFQCNHKFDGERKCQTPHLTEEEIKHKFIQVANKIVMEKAELLENTKIMMKTVCDTQKLQKEEYELEAELGSMSELAERYIAENARESIDQDEYQSKYNILINKYGKVKERYDEVAQRITDRRAKEKIFENFITTLEKQDDFITEFDEGLWCSMIDYVTVYHKNEIQFTLNGGGEIII